MIRFYLAVILILGGFCHSGLAKEEVLVDWSGKVASFQKAHKVIQNSCMPCHSAQLALPWYGRLPLVKQGMKKDYLKATKKLNLDSQVYVVGQPPSSEALNDIEQVLQEGKMPPRSYVLKHLSARLSKQEEWAILNWIRDERAAARVPVPAQPVLSQPAVVVSVAAPPPVVQEEKNESSAPAKKMNPFKPFNS